MTEKDELARLADDLARKAQQLSDHARAMSDDYADVWRDPSAQAWVDHVIGEMKPKMERSALVMQIIPRDSTGDVKLWVELGASIMMDKPLIAVAFGSHEIPEKLRRIADEVVVLEEGVTPESSDTLREAMERLLHKT